MQLFQGFLGLLFVCGGLVFLQHFHQRIILLSGAHFLGFGGQ